MNASPKHIALVLCTFAVAFFAQVARAQSDLTLQNTTHSSGTASYQATNSITAQNNFIVNGSASVTFTAGQFISLKPGFQATAATGATFRASIGAIYSLTTAVNPPGAGTISPPSGLYNGGSLVTVTAAPATGYQFTEFTGVDSSSGSVGYVTMTANRSVTANFTQVIDGVPSPATVLTGSPSRGVPLVLGRTPLPTDPTFSPQQDLIIDASNPGSYALPGASVNGGSLVFTVSAVDIRRSLMIRGFNYVVFNSRGAVSVNGPLTADGSGLAFVSSAPIRVSQSINASGKPGSNGGVGQLIGLNGATGNNGGTGGTGGDGGTGNAGTEEQDLAVAAAGVLPRVVPVPAGQSAMVPQVPVNCIAPAGPSGTLGRTPAQTAGAGPAAAMVRRAPMRLGYGRMVSLLQPRLLVRPQSVPALQPPVAAPEPPVGARLMATTQVPKF